MGKGIVGTLSEVGIWEKTFPVGQGSVPTLLVVPETLGGFLAHAPTTINYLPLKDRRDTDRGKPLSLRQGFPVYPKYTGKPCPTNLIP